MKTAIFAGSFNPLTIGHHDIVVRALPLFDRIIIAIGKNTSKNADFIVGNNVTAITTIYKNEPKISVETYRGLSVDFAKERNADFFIRGVRSVADFEYERNMAEINRQISGIETLIFFAKPNLTHISSSLVRELASYGKNVSKYLP